MWGDFDNRHIALIDRDLCIGCGICKKTCQFEAISGERKSVHAEQNAIIQAAKLGISIDGATIYCTHQPCSVCAKMIVNVGIRRVVFEQAYPDPFALEVFEESGVKLEHYPKDNQP